VFPSSVPFASAVEHRTTQGAELSRVVPMAFRVVRTRKHVCEIERRRGSDRSGEHARNRRRSAREGRSKQAIAEDMHLTVSSVAGLIRVLRQTTDAKVVVALRRPFIPYLSRMTSRIEG